MLASPLTSRASIATLLAAFTLVACSSDPADTTGSGASGPGGSGGAGASSSSSTSSGGSGGSEPECPPGPGFGGGETDVTITSAEATIIGLDGLPIADMTTLLCGLDICMPPGKTDANGHVLITGQKLKAPALKFGDALGHAELGIPLTMATTVFASLVTGKFPATGPKLEAGKDIVSGDVTLNIAAGTTIIVDELIYDTPEKQQFRTVTIPVAQETALLDPALDIELLFGVAPINTIVCPAIGVTVPNSVGFAANTAVEFYAHGIEVGQEFAPYAGWEKVSDGQVSADGATISTAAGGGFLALNTFGIRKKP